MEEIRGWFYGTRIEETIKRLVHHGFEAIRASDRSAACTEILKRIPPHKTVGIGGSVTLREIGIIGRLIDQNNTLYDHWTPGLDRIESLNVRRAQVSCDVFLTGANAVTMTGALVNMDGFCNRIAAMAFGPREVIVVAGQNKIVPGVTEAIDRIKTIAAPMNAKRFGLNPPCVQLGRCVDCDSPDRICRGTLILERQPFGMKVLVVVVQEDLGY